MYATFSRTSMAVSVAPIGVAFSRFACAHTSWFARFVASRMSASGDSVAGRVANDRWSDSTTSALATSPARWPPRPSETASSAPRGPRSKRRSCSLSNAFSPARSAMTNASSLFLRTSPTSVLPTTVMCTGMTAPPEMLRGDATPKRANDGPDSNSRGNRARISQRACGKTHPCDSFARMLTGDSSASALEVDGTPLAQATLMRRRHR